MKDSEVYLRAAETLAGYGWNEFSCNVVEQIAIEMLSFADARRLVDEYATMFSSSEGQFLTIDDAENGGGLEWRRNALCFMAAIAKSEGR